jgi:hypothetical protein
VQTDQIKIENDVEVISSEAIISKQDCILDLGDGLENLVE